jgi:hypothetical protein
LSSRSGSCVGPTSRSGTLNSSVGLKLQASSALALLALAMLVLLALFLLALFLLALQRLLNDGVNAKLGGREVAGGREKIWGREETRKN